MTMYIPALSVTPFTSQLTPEERDLLAQALSNLQEFIESETTHYVLVEDPRNDEDYDTWDVGMEPLPGDQTWKKSEAADPED